MAHALTIRADPTIDPQTVADRLDVDKERYTEVLKSQNTQPTIRPADERTDTPKTLSATLRVADADGASEIIQLLSDGTLYDAEWVVVDYHSCEHDRDGGACDGWTREVARGPVPDSL